MNRISLLLATLSTVALACSLGGSESQGQDTQEPETSGGVSAVSKATSTAPGEIVLPPATETLPTAAPQPSRGGAQPAISFSPEEEGIPIEILDVNFVPSQDLPRVYGLFRNIGATELGGVELALFFYDANGELTGMASGFSFFQRTAPGEISPFDIAFLEGIPGEPVSVSFGVQWNPAYQDDQIRREGFELEVLQEERGSFAYEIDAKLTNNNERNADVVVVTLFYNANGRLIGFDQSVVDDLGAGSSDLFKISVPFEYFAEPEFDHYEIMLEGYLP